MRKSSIKYLIIFFIINSACKDEFILETKNYEPILVIDGMITNEPSPYEIKLSLSAPINKPQNIPFENCTILLHENGIRSEAFTETEPGLYVTSPGGIQGITGNSYSISITTPNGKKYYTEPQEIKHPVEIELIYADFVYTELEDKEGIPFGLPGYQFYTDTKITPSQENYYLWKMEETFQYTADYHLYAIWNGRDILINGADTITEYEDWYRCWKTQNVNYIFAGKTNNLSIPKINNQPLHFVGTDSRKLQERYSLLLKQYTINKDAFYFWKRVEEHNSEENLLITKQPYNISGNIKNLNNTNETVFGYFTVGSVLKKRIFINAPVTDFYFDICYVDIDGSTLPPPHYIVKLENGSGGVVKESCVDCRSRGGKSIKPDFWIDN